MEYREMVQIFKENGIDIEKHGYTYGLKLVGCGPSEGYIINQNTGKYAHMVIGDRDNGRIDREYSSEDAAVADMICDIRRNAIHRKAKYNKKPDTSEINLKILNIATFLDAKVNGYKGFKISKESDRETYQSNLVATCPNVDGSILNTFRSFIWQEDSESSKKDEELAYKEIKEKIAEFLYNNEV